MPNDEKPAGEPASPDSPEAQAGKPAAEAQSPGDAKQAPAESAPPVAVPGEAPPVAAKSEVPVTPPSSESGAPGEPPAKPAPVKKAAPTESGATDAAPAGEKPAPKPAAAKPAAKAEHGEKAAAKKPAIMEVAPWEGPLVDRLRQHFAAEINECSIYLGDSFVVVKLPAAFAVLQYLKAEEGYDYLVDVTAVHYPQKPKPFEVIWILYSYEHNTRLRVKTEVAENESPRSADSLYAAANWLEREVYDMFGIKFDGHPNMTRILLPDEWQGYPLRKDYSILQQDQDWVRENLNIESGQ